jgi:hypothetical protein
MRTDSGQLRELFPAQARHPSRAVIGQAQLRRVQQFTPGPEERTQGLLGVGALRHTSTISPPDAMKGTLLRPGRRAKRS